MSLISNVRLWTRDHQNVKASGMFTVADAFDISFTLVSSKEKGLFVGLPRHSYKDKEGATQWNSDVYCKDDEARKEMTEAVMAAYKEAQANGGSNLKKETTQAPQQAQAKKSRAPF